MQKPNLAGVTGKKAKVDKDIRARSQPRISKLKKEMGKTTTKKVLENSLKLVSTLLWVKLSLKNMQKYVGFNHFIAVCLNYE